MDVNSENKQDVLLTEENGSGKMKVVSGVDENGNLKTVAPKNEHEADFFKISKHSNALENFISNYFSQVKNPKHTGFYRVAADNIESIAQVISGLLQSGEEGKQFLEEYKIDTSKYEQSEAQTHEEKREYQPMDANKVDWAMFEKIGVSREYLEKSNALDSMLNYRKSPDLVPITLTVDDVTVKTDARLSLKVTDEGRIIPAIHAVRKEPQLDRPFYGNTFTAEDKDNLLKTGNLGRVIELDIKGVENKIKAFVSVDDKTNELVTYSAKNVRIPNEIKGVTLDDTQKAALAEGKGVYVEGMTSKAGKNFNATIQINASERGIVFKFDNLPKQYQANKQDQDGVRIPTKLGGVDLTAEAQAKLKQGEVIYVEGLVDKKGQNYNAYVQVNNEKGKLDFFKWDPTKKQGVTPENKSETQNETSTELKEQKSRGVRR